MTRFARSKIAAATVGILLAGLLAVPTSSAAADPSATRIDDDSVVSNAASWQPGLWYWDDKPWSPAGASLGAFVDGPQPAPAGEGSLRLEVSSSSGQKTLHTRDWEGTSLLDISELSFSTWTDTATNDAPNFQMVAAFGGHYGEVINVGPVFMSDQPVVPGQWQDWVMDPAKTRIWSTGVGGEGSGWDPVTWNRFLELYPNAQIVGGVGFNIGSGWPTTDTYVDALTIATGTRRVTYDFEPDRLDTTPPVVQPNIQGELGTNGWYTSNVNVNWSVSDDASGVVNQLGCTPAVVDFDTSEPPVSSYQSVVREDGAIHYWRFENNSQDLIRNANLVKPEAWTFQEGLPGNGQALSHDGSWGVGPVTNEVGDLTARDELTIEFWFKAPVNTTPGYSLLFRQDGMSNQKTLLAQIRGSDQSNPGHLSSTSVGNRAPASSAPTPTTMGNGTKQPSPSPRVTYTALPSTALPLVNR